MKAILNKPFKLYLYYGIVLSGFMVFLQCHKTEPIPQRPKVSVLQNLETDLDYTILLSALRLSGLSSILSQSNNFTVFAPTNAAFQNAGFADSSAVDSLGATNLYTLLSHHILSGVNYPTSSFPVGINTPYPTLLNTSSNPDSIYLTQTTNNSVHIDGVLVSGYDILSTNGVIHPLYSILALPANNISGYISFLANSMVPSFTLLNHALMRLGLNLPNGILSGNQPYTLFAPNDSAFINAGYVNTMSIDTANINTLTQIIELSILPGRIFSSSFNLDSLHSYYAGLPISLLNSVQPPTIQVDTGGATANIIAFNALAFNGVIHTIDHILRILPPPPVDTSGIDTTSFATRYRSLRSGISIRKPFHQIK